MRLPLAELLDFRPEAQELFKSHREIVPRSKEHRLAIEHRNPLNHSGITKKTKRGSRRKLRDPETIET
jgi:hypothetical protein